MARFRIPVTFTVDAVVEVEAEDYVAACEAAIEAPLPPRDQWEYLADSFAVRNDGKWQSRGHEALV